MTKLNTIETERNKVILVDENDQTLKRPDIGRNE